MPEVPSSTGSTDDLQFVTAEKRAAGSSDVSSGQVCAVCAQPITSTYFAVADQVICPSCAEQLNTAPQGSMVGRLFKATLFGLVAGLIGATIWYAVRRIASIEVGLIAILVGFMIGTAVRKGSGNRGGRGYQLLAVLLTYLSIAATNIPDFFEAVALMQQQNAVNAPAEAEGNAGVQNPAGDEQNAIALNKPLHFAVVLFASIFYALQVPFSGGMENIIGMLIVSFALWEAWKLNAYRPLPLSGPYQLGSTPAA
jgi:hypothetical protein